ncbi:hypothetical protein, partial [Treponema saccharophilum]|uniref:hypothetical protein n=1 Tax=Treponema saccharophilum TaxID=165 RepID=UPI0038700B70
MKRNARNRGNPRRPEPEAAVTEKKSPPGKFPREIMPVMAAVIFIFCMGLITLSECISIQSENQSGFLF